MDVDYGFIDNINRSGSVYSVPLRRSSHDFCLYGPKGCGKTIILSYLGLLFLLRGKTVYSNYHLVYPHVYIDSIDAIENINSGVFLGDDFESWGSSKFRSNKEKSRLLEATLNFGKKNIDFVWTCKRPLEIDKTLRATVDYFVKCNLVLKDVPGSVDEYDYLSGFLDSHVCVLEVYDALTLKVDRIVLVDNLAFWCELYDTTEKVRSPVQSDGNLGREGNNVSR